MTRFVVRSAPATTGDVSWRLLHILPIALGFVVAGSLYSATMILLVTLLIVIYRSVGSSSFGFEAVVEVMPLGIQLTTTRTTGQSETEKRVLDRQFLPREDVVDVIISEVVLSYKVISCVMFRVRCAPMQKEDDASLLADTCDGFGTLADMMMEGTIKLVPAFPGVELSYVECEDMWEGILNAM